MINDDTIKLLRECDQGIEMGISSIDEVYDYVYSKELKNFLKESKERHLELNLLFSNQDKLVAHLLENLLFQQSDL